ncbi:hypothetical protein LCGC14_2327470, partial [marine sediment metagenome]
TEFTEEWNLSKYLADCSRTQTKPFSTTDKVQAGKKGKEEKGKMNPTQSANEMERV